MAVHERQTSRGHSPRRSRVPRPNRQIRSPYSPETGHPASKPVPRSTTEPRVDSNADTIAKSSHTRITALQRPAMLMPGDTVALISPASPIPTDGATVDDILASVSDRLEQLGLRTIVAAHATEVYGYLAGPDEDRAEDVMNAFRDPDVDGIVCMNGGYGTPRILELLDYDVIARNPKVFIGYSDITALHTAIRQRAHLVTFLGPLGFEFARHFRSTDPAIDAFTWEWFTRAIMRPEPLGPLPTQAPWQSRPIRCIVPGVARGPLVGGNLSLLSDTMGTPYEVDTTDKIMLIEDVNEAPYRIDRMLTQLRLVGKLQAAAGFIFAECINCAPANPSAPSLTLQQIVTDIVKPLGKPTVCGLAAGHGPGRLTLPLGVTVTVDASHADNCRVIVEESGVIEVP